MITGQEGDQRVREEYVKMEDKRKEEKERKREILQGTTLLALKMEENNNKQGIQAVSRS